jgi:hypothetical protein
MRRLPFAAAIALLLSLASEGFTQQQPPQAFRVRGTIIDAATGRPPDNPKMKLIFKPLAGLRESPLSPIYSSVTGKFEVDNVPPGSHILQANFQLLDAAARAAGEAAWSMFPTARIPIVVTDKDLEDVALILTRPIAVPGRVRIEGPPIAIPSGTLRLEPAAGGTQWLPPTAFVQADGVFRVDGLVDGEYFLRFGSALRSHYVKTITYDGVDILNQPWRFSGSGGGTIEVVLRAGAAQLSGVVTDARSQPFSRGMAVLVPDQRDRKDLYGFAPLDANGRFSFAGIAPGDYKLFSFAEQGRGASSDPEFIKRFEEQGKRIHIVESANDTVDLRVIPIP